MKIEKRKKQQNKEQQLIWLTPVDREKLAQLAAEANLSISEFVSVLINQVEIVGEKTNE